MKRFDPLKGFEVFTNRLRRFKREKTTKGILRYIRKHQNETTPVNETIPVSEFGNDEFMEMMEKVFQYIPSDSPKMLMCVHCGEAVTVPEICSCGKIQDVYEAIERLMNEAK